MKIHNETITVASNSHTQVMDVTDRALKTLRDSGVKNGKMTIFSKHTTCAININENEEGLLKDMEHFLETHVPKDGRYKHNAYDPRGNANSHILGLLTNSSETIPVVDGEMQMGTWQSIFFIELDGPRPERSFIVQVMGE